MKNCKTIFIFLVLLTILMLTGCGCEHQWVEGTCDAPEICSLCGKTQGVATEHYFREATCELPKTCTKCGLTEGEPNGHDFDDATCTTAQKCKNCTKVQGTKLGHDYDYGVCTRCYEVDENFRDYDNYGFIDLANTNDLCIDVFGYSLGVDSYVKVKRLAFKTFYQNYTVNGSITDLKNNLSAVSSCNDTQDLLSLNVYEEGDKAQCIYDSNDVIRVADDGYWERVSIYEREVRSEEKIVILKTIDESSREVWFVPCNSLDFTTIEKDPDEDGIYRIYVK